MKGRRATRRRRFLIGVLCGCLLLATIYACSQRAPHARSAEGTSAGRIEPSRPEKDRNELTAASVVRDYAVHVVDVGTGLAVFVEGEDFSLVYDAGSNDDLATGAENRFVAYLHAIRPDLKRTDHVVLSHPHRDHVELLADVIESFAVTNVWDSGAVNPICGYRRFIEAVAHSGASYHSGVNGTGRHVIDFGEEACRPGLPATVRLEHGAQIEEGKAIRLGAGATMTFLHVDGSKHGGDYNRNSLVAAMTLGQTRVLFMGDAEAGGREDPSKVPTEKSIEGYLLAHHRDQVDADVLVVGHHGSKSSSRSSFIDAVSPNISIISSGPTQYHHVTLPDAEVVEELELAGTLLRTDHDDARCENAPTKIGPDADGAPGGCSNIQVRIRGARVSAAYADVTD